MSRENAKTSNELTPLTPAGLTLRDTNVVTASCERKQLPEEAPRGRVDSEHSLEINLGERRKKRGLVAVLSLQMSGSDMLEDKSAGELAFVTKLNLEGFFEFIDQEIQITDDAMTVEIAKGILTQLVPIASLKVREMANSMGYQSIRQPIGFNINDFKVSEVSSRAEAQVQGAKRVKASPRKLAKKMPK